MDPVSYVFANKLVLSNKINGKRELFMNVIACFLYAQTFKAETKVIKTQVNMKTQDSSDALPAGKKTLSAFGPGLTCIMQSEVGYC